MPGSTHEVTSRLGVMDGPSAGFFFCCDKKYESYLEGYKMKCCLLVIDMVMTWYDVVRYLDFLKVLFNNFPRLVGFVVRKDFSHLQRAKFTGVFFHRRANVWSDQILWNNFSLSFHSRILTNIYMIERRFVTVDDVQHCDSRK